MASILDSLSSWFTGAPSNYVDVPNNATFNNPSQPNNLSGVLQGSYIDPNSGNLAFNSNAGVGSADQQIAELQKQIDTLDRNNTNGGGGGSIPAPQSQNPTKLANDYISNILNTITKPFLDAAQRAKEFDANNPFSFDEAAANASASERLDPYYNATLSDYLTGVNRQRQRTVQDQQALREELSTEATNTSEQTANALDKALRSSEQGYASAGLFGSGEQNANSGEQTVSSNQNLSDYLRKNQYQQTQSTNTQNRTLQDLTSNENTFNRNLTAEQTTAKTQDVQQQQQEAEKQYELTRQNYIGYPLAGGSSSLSSILGLS